MTVMAPGVPAIGLADSARATRGRRVAVKTASASLGARRARRLVRRSRNVAPSGSGLVARAVTDLGAHVTRAYQDASGCELAAVAASSTLARTRRAAGRPSDATASAL